MLRVQSAQRLCRAAAAAAANARLSTAGRPGAGQGQATLPPQVHQTVAGRRRFYKQVSVEEVSVATVAAEGEGAGAADDHRPTAKASATAATVAGSSSTTASATSAGFRVLLDGRALKTPARAPLVLPTVELALAIAAEWDAQTDGLRGIQPRTMPLMTLACTAIDQVAVDAWPTKQTILSYLPTDSALFFTTEEDRILLRKQKQHFQPTVRWVRRAFGIEVKTVAGSFAARIQHDESAGLKLRAVLDGMDPFSLTCLQGATMECKSVLLGLAFLSRHLTLDQVRAASRLEEECQIEWWGAVEGGHDLDRLNNAVSLSSVGAFMGLLRSPDQHEQAFARWVAAAATVGPDPAPAAPQP